MKTKPALILLLSLFFSFELFAQRDREEEEDKDGIMKEFTEKRQSFLEKTAGTKNLTSLNFKEWQSFNQANVPMGYTAANGNWTQAAINKQSTAGMGRINCFAIQPGAPSTMWVGTPTGGLWKTPNNGGNWFNYTDVLPVPGIAGICIDPNFTNTIYILTGSFSTLDCQSVGVLKSTDGGFNWFATGLNATRKPVSSYLGPAWNANKLLMDPNNSNVLFACMTDGLFRTQDAGATWTNVLPGQNVSDMVFHPTNSNIIYITTAPGQVSCSKDNGLTFSTSKSVPVVPAYPNTQSTTLAVSPAAPDSLFLCLTVAKPGAENIIAVGRAKYTLASNSLTFGYSDLSRYDEGAPEHNLSEMTCALRTWRDARLSVSPATTANMYVGGLDTWSTSNYGKSWIVKSVNRSPHSDCSQMQYIGTDIYTCNDGGIYKQQGSTTDPAVPWNILTGKMSIQQIWRLGISQASTTDFFLALQDNGGHLQTASTYEYWIGGDGVMAKMDPGNPSLFYGKGADASKILFKIRNGNRVTFNPTNSDPDEVNTNFIPFEIDQKNGKNLYTAFKALYKSTDTGNTWKKYSFGGTNETKLMAVAQSNQDVIWLVEEGSFTVRKTVTGGSLFGQIIFPDTIPRASINNIVISPFNDDRVYLVMDGYTAGKKVYTSTNGGITWKNISYNLPNVPVYTLAYEDVADNSIYIGTELGVYYFNTNINKWISYNNGLPLTRVQELFINYNAKKLVAATYGRGIFTTDLYGGNCNATVTLAGSINQLNTYSAGTQLNSTQYIYGGANSNVRYYSGGSVSLQPGFIAQNGSQFIAAIAACGGPIDPVLNATSTAKSAADSSIQKVNAPILIEPKQPAGNKTKDNKRATANQHMLKLN